jgi:hypothetical protein
MEGGEMRTSELSGAALDWAVALCEGWQPERVRDDRGEYWWFFKDSRGMNPKHYHPSSHWGIGGAIIEREEISVSREFASNRIEWAAWTPAPIRDDAEAFGYGESPLIAAMRCYVASKLGDDVELPEGV